MMRTTHIVLAAMVYLSVFDCAFAWSAELSESLTSLVFQPIPYYSSFI
jgi:hypothetical protein